MSESRTFNIESVGVGNFLIEVWCDGRKYDPAFESYRPVYSYKITGPEWEYTSNDIHGACNEVPDAGLAARSLFAFLYACQEGMPGDTEKRECENADLFPPHVREFAYLCSEHISAVYQTLVEEVSGKSSEQ
jgi:hypothetical protein